MMAVKLASEEESARKGAFRTEKAKLTHVTLRIAEIPVDPSFPG
jgi:hypothetical protein